MECQQASPLSSSSSSEKCEYSRGISGASKFLSYFDPARQPPISMLHHTTPHHTKQLLLTSGRRGRLVRIRMLPCLEQLLGFREENLCFQSTIVRPPCHDVYIVCHTCCCLQFVTPRFASNNERM